MGSTPERIKRAVHKYDKENTRKMTFKFNRNTDADILEKLASVPNKQGYIKRLIRDDIEKNGSGS